MSIASKKPAKPLWIGLWAPGLWLTTWAIFFGDNSQFSLGGYDWYLFDWVQFAGILMMGAGAVLYGVATVSRIKAKSAKNTQTVANAVGVQHPQKANQVARANAQSHKVEPTLEIDPAVRAFARIRKDVSSK